MRSIALLFVVVSVAACGDSNDNALADDDGEVTFCDCANSPITSDRKHAACTAMIEAMGPEETTRRAMECRSNLPVPEDGPDLCFCVNTVTPDPDIVEACKKILPEEPSDAQLATILIRCAR